MKILKFKEIKSAGQYKIDEYTSSLGEVIFDGSKGGNVSNSYFFRFNKNAGNTENFRSVSPQASAMIDFYINEVTHQFQLIDFVLLKFFDIVIDESLVWESSNNFYEPVIDISTWVSPFGAKKYFSYDPENKWYLNNEDQVNVKIVHNGQQIVQFIFGEMKRRVDLNEQICIHVDEFMNLSSIVICDEVEVPKLISQLN